MGISLVPDSNYDPDKRCSECFWWQKGICRDCSSPCFKQETAPEFYCAYFDPIKEEESELTKSMRAEKLEELEEDILLIKQNCDENLKIKKGEKVYYTLIAKPEVHLPELKWVDEIIENPDIEGDNGPISLVLFAACGKGKNRRSYYTTLI